MYKTSQFWLEIQFNLLSYPVFQIFRTVFIFLIYSSQWSQEQAKHQIGPSDPLLLVLQDAPIGLNLHLQGELDLNQLLVLLLPCTRKFCVSHNSHTHTNECNFGLHFNIPRMMFNHNYTSATTTNLPWSLSKGVESRRPSSSSETRLFNIRGQKHVRKMS